MDDNSSGSKTLLNINDTSTALSPKESGRFIAEHADHVRILDQGIQTVANLIHEHITSAEFSSSHPGAGYRSHPLHPQKDAPDAADWVFLITALNFNFWAPDGSVKYQVKHDGVMYDGYYSICAAIKNAKDRGEPITDPAYYSSLDLNSLKRLLQSDTETEAPLIKERHEAITEAGKTLVARYGGSFANCVRQCSGSAQRLLRLIVTEFASFRDEAVFKQRRVALYKRAQILVADLWLCFDGRGLGHFDDFGSLTMFADYRIPQTLAYLGALQYSPALAELLRSEHVFAAGHPMEVEIRGCSIEAVERIVAAIRETSKGSIPAERLNSIVVDNFLWGYRRDHVKETSAVPYHRVRSIYY